MKILMFGWEYPPQISGGLATACHGMVQALLKIGHHVTFVMPKADKEQKRERFQLISASNVTLSSFPKTPVFSLVKKIIPYVDPGHIERIKEGKYEFSGAYGPNLLEEVYWLTIVASKLAKELDFDVIHAHDWLTYLAGMVASEISGKPLVVHMHATEFDRSAQTNPRVYEIERQGMLAADKVMAVSNLTRKIIIDKYGIAPEKVVTAYNGVIQNEKKAMFENHKFKDKIVTFLGRITYQKGPDYFLEAAEKVLEKNPNVRFVMAGNGDMMSEIIRKVADKRLSSHFHFTGFLRGADVDRMLSMSDVFVMPSVSEPFGIAPLEAIQSDVPIIISKQSGVAEVLPHALKVDYWDTDALAGAIHGILNHKALATTIKEMNKETLQHLTWENASTKVAATYASVA